MLPNDIFSQWKQIRTGLIDIINQFDEQDLVFKPHPTSWPAGRIALHIASAEEGWFRYAVSGELDEWPEDFRLANFPNITSILKILGDVHQKTEIFLDSLSEADLETIIKTPWQAEIPLMWIVWHVIEHEIHHRGELSLILGILGKGGLDVK